jgi:hypothetical protein
MIPFPSFSHLLVTLSLSSFIQLDRAGREIERWIKLVMRDGWIKKGGNKKKRGYLSEFAGVVKWRVKGPLLK